MKEKTSKSWRKQIYISQVPELMRKNSINRSPFKDCTCYICTDHDSGANTTGIVFPNGKVFVGDDVWRMSNRADCCEYPYRKYQNLKMAKLQYDFKIPNQTFLSKEKKEGSDHYVYE